MFLDKRDGSELVCWTNNFTSETRWQADKQNIVVKPESMYDICHTVPEFSIGQNSCVDVRRQNNHIRKRKPVQPRVESVSYLVAGVSRQVEELAVVVDHEVEHAAEEVLA